MIWLWISMGVYLAIGVFILMVIVKGGHTRPKWWQVLAALFGWLPIWIFGLITLRQ